MASMLELSLAVTLIVPPAERFAVPAAAVSRAVASTKLLILLKLSAPVALAAMPWHYC